MASRIKDCSTHSVARGGCRFVIAVAMTKMLSAKSSMFNGSSF